jgi:hypothetical protein
VLRIRDTEKGGEGIKRKGPNSRVAKWEGIK